MRKIRGFKIGKRLLRFWKNRKLSGYQPLSPITTSRQSMPRPICKLIKWGRSLTARAKSLYRSSSKTRWGYLRVGQDPIMEEAVPPKGQLAVYVGQKDGDFHRVLVPVIYFNHPLFGELLRNVEEEYGYSHQGGITIPCRFSEFERVQTRIAAAGSRSTRKLTCKPHQ
ncbi:Auxin_inducible domain-containing protein [Cephalotus follicularis]|uniref:Auxin_inducible domain-containing protein n=1 Tax=Cephalotus follicularis TaxID=3775 RepID=A0A1Q3CEL5_CEPFO|nr:Auxin_inducible domain-containing protein [Cephalotus follicularis]